MQGLLPFISYFAYFMCFNELASLKCKPTSFYLICGVLHLLEININIKAGSGLKTNRCFFEWSLVSYFPIINFFVTQLLETLLWLISLKLILWFPVTRMCLKILLLIFFLFIKSLVY